MILVAPIKVRVEGTSRPAKLNAPIPVTPEMMMVLMMVLMMIIMIVLVMMMMMIEIKHTCLL
jgi:hypothetical protein